MKSCYQNKSHKNLNLNRNLMKNKNKNCMRVFKNINSDMINIGNIQKSFLDKTNNKNRNRNNQSR